MGETALTRSREEALLRGLVWAMRRTRTVRTPYDLAVAMGLLDGLHARPTASQEDHAARLIVYAIGQWVPGLSALATEAALFGELGFGSSVVAKTSRAV